MKRSLPALLLAASTALADVPREVEPSPIAAALSHAPRGPDARVLDHALDAWRCARQRGDLDDARAPDTLVVIDYSLPSTAPRLWVLDAPTGRVLHHLLVAHGRNTGEDEATRFSNVAGSLQTSLGVFRTAETYVGRHGRSLRLDGLEPGINDRARERAIVVHGADYATADFAEAHGRLGRSWGCPAVAPDAIGPLLDTIEGGSLVVAWYPDPTWLTRSSFLHCSG